MVVRMRCGVGCLLVWALIGGLSQGVMAQTPQAAPPRIKTQAPGYYRMKLGDFELTTVSDGTVTMPIEKLLTNTTPAEVDALLARSRHEAPTEASINTFLINTGRHLILVDAGAGKLFGPAGGGAIVANLRAAGYAPEQVDAVLLTHIHGDHSVGLTVDGARVFPNAQVHVNRVERDFWLSADEAARAADQHKHAFQEAHDALDPYIKAGQVRPFDGVVELFPGITTRPMPGHTPGHTFYVIESRGDKLVITGDTVHMAEVQFPRPSVTIQFDVDPAAAARQRAAFFAEAAAVGFWVGGDHISFPGIGHIRTDEGGFAWMPAPYRLTH